MIIDGLYSYPLIILSVFIAILAAYVAIDIGSFAIGEYSSEKHKRKWLFVASVALSIGIWTMHFIGMLAYQLPIDVRYDVNLTVLSFLLAVLGCFLGFFYSHNKSSTGHIFVGGMFMGVGIAAMHYIGMMAMRLPAMMVFNYLLVSASVLIAVVISFFSLLVILSPRYESLTNLLYKKEAAAILTGLAISSMHYIGMRAVSFVSIEDVYGPAGQTINADSIVITMGFAAIILILFPLLSKSSAQHIAELQAQKVLMLQKNERKLMRLIESVKDAVIVINNVGLIQIFNQGAVKIFGYLPEEVLNRNISILMPEPYKSEHDGYLQRYLSSGRTSVMDFKYRNLEGCDKYGRVFPV